MSPQGPSVCNSPITPCSLNSCRVYIGSSLRGERAGQGHPTSPFPTFQGCGSWLRGAGSLLAFLIRIHLCSWELHVSGGWGQGWGAEVFDCWMVWPWGFPLPLALCGLPPTPVLCHAPPFSVIRCLPAAPPAARRETPKLLSSLLSLDAPASCGSMDEFLPVTLCYRISLCFPRGLWGVSAPRWDCMRTRV